MEPALESKSIAHEEEQFKTFATCIDSVYKKKYQKSKTCLDPLVPSIIMVINSFTMLIENLFYILLPLIQDNSTFKDIIVLFFKFFLYYFQLVLFTMYYNFFNTSNQKQMYDAITNLYTPFKRSYSELLPLVYQINQEYIDQEIQNMKAELMEWENLEPQPEPEPGS